jgi:uncharacterized protein
VLVYAHRKDAVDHGPIKTWLEKTVNRRAPFGLSPHVLSGVLRVVTHPKVFDPPSPIDVALEFVESLRSRPNCVEIQPGPRHWEIFVDLCRAGRATGNDVPDAYLAALAIESGSEWVTTDGGFSRYEGLRWRHPLG